MQKALIFLASGFEEIEAVTVIDLLRRANIEVNVCGLLRDQVKGSHNITILVDSYYQDVNPDEYDVVILPGGQPGTKNLIENETILKWIKQRNSQKKLVAAICAAPTVFQVAGILESKKVTVYPNEKNQFPKNNYVECDVIQDENMITSRSAGVAIEFSLKLIEALKGAETAKEIADKILYRRNKI
jgi:4-methyl-5(b-hydroxyethyl)-thiazole monophosphate biosynthesis